MKNNFSANNLVDAQVSVKGIPTVKKLSEAATYFGLSDYTVRRWVNEGHLPCIRADVRSTLTSKLWHSSCKAVAFRMSRKLQRLNIQHMFPQQVPKAPRCLRFSDRRQVL